MTAEIGKSDSILRGDTSFLFFFAGIDLHKAGQVTRLLLHLACKNTGKFLAINTFDHIKETDSISCLVRLQGADQAQFEIRVICPAVLPAAHGFLHTVFAKNPDPGGKGGNQAVAAAKREANVVDGVLGACGGCQGAEATGAARPAA